VLVPDFNRAGLFVFGVQVDVLNPPAIGMEDFFLVELGIFSN
jgi:hypothetical protein